MTFVSKKFGRPFVSCPLAITWAFRCHPLPLKTFLQPDCDDDLRWKRKTVPKEGPHLKWRKMFCSKKKGSRRCTPADVLITFSDVLILFCF